MLHHWYIPIRICTHFCVYCSYYEVPGRASSWALSMWDDGNTTSGPCNAIKRLSTKVHRRIKWFIMRVRLIPTSLMIVRIVVYKILYTTVNVISSKITKLPTHATSVCSYWEANHPSSNFVNWIAHKHDRTTLLLQIKIRASSYV